MPGFFLTVPQCARARTPPARGRRVEGPSAPSAPGSSRVSFGHAVQVVKPNLATSFQPEVFGRPARVEVRDASGHRFRGGRRAA